MTNAKDDFQAATSNRSTVLYESKIAEEVEREIEECFKKEVIFARASKRLELKSYLEDL